MERSVVDYPVEFLKCRGFHHSWDDSSGPANPPRLQFGTHFWWFCSDCTMYRLDVVSRDTGELLWRTYIQPKNYKAKGPITKSDCRKRYVRLGNKRRSRKKYAA